jgi:hypothetical protein
MTCTAAEDVKASAGQSVLAGVAAESAKTTETRDYFTKQSFWDMI